MRYDAYHPINYLRKEKGVNKVRNKSKGEQRQAAQNTKIIIKRPKIQRNIKRPKVQR